MNPWKGQKINENHKSKGNIVGKAKQGLFAFWNSGLQYFMVSYVTFVLTKHSFKTTWSESWQNNLYTKSVFTPLFDIARQFSLIKAGKEHQMTYLLLMFPNESQIVCLQHDILVREVFSILLHVVEALSSRARLSSAAVSLVLGLEKLAFQNDDLSIRGNNLRTWLYTHSTCFL